jgi:hypothetical protein
MVEIEELRISNCDDFRIFTVNIIDMMDGEHNFFIHTLIRSTSIVSICRSEKEKNEFKNVCLNIFNDMPEIKLFLLHWFNCKLCQNWFHFKMCRINGRT